MSNPVLNEKALQQSRAAWAPPTPGTDYLPPITDGPISTYRSVNDRMTRGGVMTATGVMFVLLLAGGVFGWRAVDAPPEALRSFPSRGEEAADDDEPLPSDVRASLLRSLLRSLLPAPAA